MDIKEFGQGISSATQFYAYIHSRPDGNHFYVGKGSGDRSNPAVLRNAHHANIVRKYGSENIIVREYSCDSEQEAFELERMLIRGFRMIGVTLTNRTDGGEGVSGLVHSAATRQKMSIAHDRQSNEIRAKRTEAARTPEARKKISLATQARMANAEVLANLAAAAKRQMADPEMRAKLSALAKKRMSNPANREILSVAALKRAADPVLHAKICTASKQAMQRPEVKKILSDNMKKQMSDPVIMAKMSAAHKEAMRKPEVREKLSISAKKRMADPAVREAMSRKEKERHATKRAAKLLQEV